MKAFRCQYCGQPLYFENRLCVSCGRRLGYIASRRELSALEPSGGSPDIWRALSEPGRTFRFCGNAVFDSCNWLVPAGPAEPAYCRTCRHNHIIPDLSSPDRLERWRKIQVAQHRLFDALLALDVPLSTRVEDPKGLGFNILYDPHENAPQGPSVLTGYDDGLITLNLMEADDSARERVRHDLDEPYRTLLGHFRHEVGHYVWQRMVADGPLIEAFRSAFGDERCSYEDSLKQYYQGDDPPADWRERYVSAYASAHPWEDFAETWAHYLHMVDTLETASAFGVRLTPSDGDDPADLDPYGEISLDRLIGAWLPLTFAVNSLNRSMGQPDLYPFLPEPTVIAKLAFVHDLVRGQGRVMAEPDRSRHAIRAVIAGLKARVGHPDLR